MRRGVRGALLAAFTAVAIAVEGASATGADCLSGGGRAACDAVILAEPAAASLERLSAIAEALARHRSATGTLPSSVFGLSAIAIDPALLVDAWGNPIRYVRVAGPEPGLAGAWLMSWGADGAPGGEGDEADLVRLL